jgi:hypothetical protein
MYFMQAFSCHVTLAEWQRLLRSVGTTQEENATERCSGTMIR